MKFLLVALIALTIQENNMAGFDQEYNPIPDFTSGTGPDTSSYRFVPSGTQQYDAQGRPSGSYFPINSTAGQNDPMSGISIDDFTKQGLKGEAPWTGKANNSSLSDLAEVTKGFFTDTGGAGGLIAGPLLGAGASELFGAGGASVPTDWGGGWDAYGSTGGEGGGFGGGADYGPEFDTTAVTDPARGAGGGYPVDQGVNFDSTAVAPAGGGGFGGGAQSFAASDAGGDGAFLGGFEDLAPAGEGGSPIGGDPNAPDPDELRRRAAASIGKPVDTVTAGVPSAGSPAAPTAGAPAAGAGGKGFIQKAIDSATNSPLSAASLGLNLYKQSQANKQGKDAQSQLAAVAQPASDASKQLIAEGLAGNVPAPILTQFNKTAEQQKAAIDSRYAQMGRDPNNDSSAAAEKAKIDEARDAQIANYASTLLQQGLTAAGVANAPATQAILAGVNSDREMQSAMSQMLQQMAFLESVRATKGGATPP